jgi:hypothetical protein
MDLWRLYPDGTGLSRVTWFGGAPNGWGGFTQHAGWPAPSYVVAGELAFDQADPHSMYAAVASDANAKNVDCYLDVA